MHDGYHLLVITLMSLIVAATMSLIAWRVVAQRTPPVGRAGRGARRRHPRGSGRVTDRRGDVSIDGAAAPGCP